MTLDQTCEFLEVTEVLVEDPSHHIEIDFDVVVHEHVAETRDAPNAAGSTPAFVRRSIAEA